MKTMWKAALGVTALGLLGACQPYGYEGYGGAYYGGGAGYGYGYCDSFGCPDNYWDQPLYYGSVYYGGRWNTGPFYYRDWNGGRQYWLGGGWRNDDWRGARPQQYRNDRVGPALGRQWYQNNRPGFDRNNDGRPDFNPNGGRGGRGPGMDRNNDGRPDFGPRGGRNPDAVQQQRSQTPPPDRFGRDRAASPPPARSPQTNRGQVRVPNP